MASSNALIESNVTLIRQLFVVRHADRMDYAFGHNWVDKCFGYDGEYRQLDENMPKTIPRRTGAPDSFDTDTPITVRGKCRAVALGNSIRGKGIKLEHVYSSPALRCVETASGIVQGLDTSSKISIEPGLFELLSLYSEIPQFMTVDELVAADFHIDTTYEPIWPYSDYNEDEDRDGMYERNGKTIEEIVKRHQTQGGNILIVGHAASLDSCTRMLLKLPPVDDYEFHRVLCSHYCQFSSVQEHIDEMTDQCKWKAV